MKQPAITALLILALGVSLFSCGFEQNTIEIETKSSPIGYQNKNDLRKINVQGYSYTAEEIRLFLYEALTTAKAPQIDKLYLWHKKRIGYAYYVSAELNCYDPTDIDKTMHYFSGLTGIEFYKADKWEDVDFFLGLSTKYSDLKDIEFIRELYAIRKGGMSGYEERWAALDDSEVNIVTTILPVNSTSDSDVPQLTIGFTFHKFDKSLDANRIKKGVVSLVMSSMIYKLGVPFGFESSVLSKGYHEPPYIWPFDEALLKIMYGDPNLAGMQLDKAIDQIVETFVQQYGINEQ